MVRPATIAITSREVLWRFDSTTMRAKRGSIGSCASSRPVFVSVTPTPDAPPSPDAPFATVRVAPSSLSRSRPSLMPRESGGVRKGKAAMSPSPSEIIWRMTAARFVRRISGSVNSGRFWKSSSEYRRIAMPSLVRPDRPERWLALACEMASIGRRCTLARTL